MRHTQRSAVAGAVAIMAMAAMATIASTGCAKRDAQRAVQVSLTGLAHGVNAADELVASAWPEAAQRARAQVVEEREASPGMTVDQGMARYDELLAKWTLALQAMRTVRQVLYTGQTAVDAWISSGRLPEQWIAFCAGVGATVANVIALLGEINVEVPVELQGAGRHASRACALAEPWLSGSLASPAGPSERDE